MMTSSGAHHLLSSVIKLGIRHQRKKKERKKEMIKEKIFYGKNVPKARIFC